MSKNTNASGFRRIDVDAYNDEDNVNDDGNESGIDERGPNEIEVKKLLDSKKNFDALQIVLKSAPLNTKNQEVKDNAFQVVLSVLRSFQSNDIDNAIKQLEIDQIDVLMKYIYKGFEKEPKYSSVLLNWHEKVYSVGGTGCVVRVLSDRKRV